MPFYPLVGYEGGWYPAADAAEMGSDDWWLACDKYVCASRFIWECVRCVTWGGLSRGFGFRGSLRYCRKIWNSGSSESNQIGRQPMYTQPCRYTRHKLDVTWPMAGIYGCPRWMESGVGETRTSTTSAGDVWFHTPLFTICVE